MVLVMFAPSARNDETTNNRMKINQTQQEGKRGTTAGAGGKTPRVDRRWSLLEATCRVIARRGLRGLRVEEVAAEANVSTALIYYHFGDRGGLLAAAFDHADRVITDYADAGTIMLPPLQRLIEQALGEFHYNARARGMAAVWFEMWAGARFEPALFTRVEPLVAAWVTGFAGVISEAQATGDIDPKVDAEASAVRIIALIEGLRPRWLQGDLSTEAARALLAEGIRRELYCPVSFAEID